MRNALQRLDRAIFGRLYESYTRALEEEILGSGCRTLLDVGCGSSSPVRDFSRRLERSVGVDAFGPSVEASRERGIHDDYRVMDVLKMEEEFGPKSFDAVVALDLIEHLPRDAGLRLLDAMERVARRRVIVFTPTGFLKQDPYEGNAFQEHLSGWEPAEMRARGYRVLGMSGWKRMRGERWEIAWKPRMFWTQVSALTQLFTRGHPEWAYQMLCVKSLGAPAT